MKREFHLILALLLSTSFLEASRTDRGIKDLKAALSAIQPQPSLGACDFEQICDWTWNRTSGFIKITPAYSGDFVPLTDASNSERGHFLWLSGKPEGQVWSTLIPRTGSRCLLELALYQVRMINGAIRLVIETVNRTSWVAAERSGTDHAKWESTRFNLGAISQPYQLIFEAAVPFENSSIAIDNIKLVDCFPESTPVGSSCTDDMFRCNNGSCLNRTRVCDLTADCADGEDEAQDCDRMPENTRCHFENGWCGWSNVPGRPLNWTLNQGPTPTERTGPDYDHTYRNATGTYAFVDMSQKAKYGARGTIESPVFNPTPPYSADRKSPYYHSCQVRFFYHQHGAHSGSLGLYLVQIKSHQNQSDRLWWNYGSRSDAWYNQAIALPDIRYKYFLQFEASKGYASMGDVAIDDFSLSPECFGLGVPPEVANNFNYYAPVILDDRPPNKHTDFVNKTVIRITTCNAVGRMGPTPEQCISTYNVSTTDVEVVSATEDVPSLRGVQRWIAPQGGFYTIIALGARGGRGSGGMGNTKGALVRGVIELVRGQQLFFMIGQPGTDACPKNLGLKTNDCQQSSKNNIGTSGIGSIVHEVKKIEFKDGGGGGGGATYIFTVKSNGEQHPLLVAAGGGGLGMGKPADDGIQHGRGPAPFGRPVMSGVTLRGDAGGGGGWNDSSDNTSVLKSTGIPLIHGGIGGIGCGAVDHRNHGDGGFGGGGGGCLTGGGGGGYIGGSTGHRESGNGEGGYSYVSPKFSHVSFLTGANRGPGEVLIIPAISGCGCDFRCVALDEHLSETRCLCPLGWHLGNDSRSCLMDNDYDVAHRTFMILLITVSAILLFAFSGLCLLLYNRYQHRKALLRRRQVMFGNGTELTSLRAVSDSMMTEFNPNYEFAGNLYSFKDLPQIPRDNVSLVKPLGQGAFGEVFQGIYKYRRNEEHPVAVKTLPSLSTSQAEADFMMEALIMSKFNHPNIVHFIGVSFDKHPRYIVLELLAGGDLKNFLREERPRPDRPTSLTMRDLIVCAYDVANGCKYMEEARFIHRDIAARNCLLTCKGPGRVVKIADFGMARDIYRSDYYRKGGKAMLPIKWMPPESFLDGIFTTKTDVWAFGVLLWEIMSFGYMPYTGCANREVMSMVTTGGRLEKPAGCPGPIYRIMTRCWHPRPEDRPSFSTIVERIGYCLQDPDVVDHPTPNYDVLPVCEREITIMRPDPETECINVHADLDGCGYMQPRSDIHAAAYRPEQVPPGVVYASLRHELEKENQQGCDDREDPVDGQQLSPKGNENSAAAVVDTAASDEKLTTSSSSSPAASSTDSPADTTVATSNVQTGPNSPNRSNVVPNNVNGVLRKNALKAALSLDPSALCRGTIPYEKIAFSPPPPRLSNPGSIELTKESLSHELPREEECSC